MNGKISLIIIFHFNYQVLTVLTTKTKVFYYQIKRFINTSISTAGSQYWADKSFISLS